MSVALQKLFYLVFAEIFHSSQPFHLVSCSGSFAEIDTFPRMRLHVKNRPKTSHTIMVNSLWIYLFLRLLPPLMAGRGTYQLIKIWDMAQSEFLICEKERMKKSWRILSWRKKETFFYIFHSVFEKPRSVVQFKNNFKG
jgi:hypothetical protein